MGALYPEAPDSLKITSYSLRCNQNTGAIDQHGDAG